MSFVEGANVDTVQTQSNSTSEQNVIWLSTLFYYSERALAGAYLSFCTRYAVSRSFCSVLNNDWIDGERASNKVIMLKLNGGVRWYWYPIHQLLDRDETWKIQHAYHVSAGNMKKYAEISPEYPASCADVNNVCVCLCAHSVVATIVCSWKNGKVVML